MGVRGLQTVLTHQVGATWRINILDEIQQWKRQNPNQTPTIIIDFLSLSHSIVQNMNDTICGGRYRVTTDSFKDILNALKSSECSLVFFADSNIHKIDNWLSRMNEKFGNYLSLYESINNGETLLSISVNTKAEKNLETPFSAMKAIAETYGEFHYTVEYKYDMKLAQYAKREKPLAVITDDTNFLIFDGEWRFWMSKFIELTSENQLMITEFDREAVSRLSSLTKSQLPLLATLVGSDYTVKYINELRSFARSLGPLRSKLKNVGNYVREFGNSSLSHEDLERIAERVFCDRSMANIIEQSIASYNTDFEPVTIDDPLEEKLLKTSMYRQYVTMMSKTQGLAMPFYDMHHSHSGIHAPVILADWIKRKIGVLRKHNNDHSFTFTLLAKKRIDQPYIEHTESPIYPDFEVPPLEQLYMGQENDQLDEIKWKIFGWIMSLSDDVISGMKKLPKNFLLICATLYALVKKSLISVLEADGILYTEWKACENDAMNVIHPVTVTSANVRAAHVYAITFEHVRFNFSIAGLLSSVQGLLRFDGVYYQNVMDHMRQMNESEIELFVNEIKDYRIYA